MICSRYSPSSILQLSRHDEYEETCLQAGHDRYDMRTEEERDHEQVSVDYMRHNKDASVDVFF